MLVIYCCLTNYETEWLKTMNIYYLTVSVGQEYERDLAASHIGHN